MVAPTDDAKSLVALHKDSHNNRYDSIDSVYPLAKWTSCEESKNKMEKKGYSSGGFRNFDKILRTNLLTADSSCHAP